MPKFSKKVDRIKQRGLAALDARNFEEAERALTHAVRLDRRNATLRSSLGIALQNLGYADDAMREYCEALAISPSQTETANLLSGLLRRFGPEDPCQLNAAGLKAAMAHETVDAQPMVDAAFALLASSGDFADVMKAEAKSEKITAEQQQKLLGKVSKIELLQKSLMSGKVTNIAIEKCLTTLRKTVLIHIPPERMLQDRALFTFVLAMIIQCDINEYVWSVTGIEEDALSELRIDTHKLTSGDIGEAWKICLQLLYAPLPQSSAASLSEEELKKIRPKALATHLASIACNQAKEQTLAARMVGFSGPVDDIGRRVANQYEASPYPRWTCLQTSRPGARRRAMIPYFGEPALEFMDEPFDVLIAGCGTGQHVAQAASAYGPTARVLGIDISVASLAYGQRMCESHGIENVEFAQADILDLTKCNRKFDIIESVGVLHHMADPFAGWQSLIEQLRPTGLIYLGLYSQAARRNISTLRDHEKYPGAGCSDEAARAFRQLLIAESQSEHVNKLMQSQDFYALSDFRDLILHENEHQLNLAQIETAIKDFGLSFQGFTIDPLIQKEFDKKFPEDKWPGQLSNWAQLETLQTSTFDGMYQFWCRRAAQL